MLKRSWTAAITVHAIIGLQQMLSSVFTTQGDCAPQAHAKVEYTSDNSSCIPAVTIRGGKIVPKGMNEFSQLLCI